MANLHNAIPTNGRETLRRSLVDLLSVADSLGAIELRDATEACLLLLESPFRINQETIAPLLKLTHERAAAVFKEGARDAEGPLKARLKDCQARAEDQAKQMQPYLPTRFS